MSVSSLSISSPRKVTIAAGNIVQLSFDYPLRPDCGVSFLKNEAGVCYLYTDTTGASSPSNTNALIVPVANTDRTNALPISAGTIEKLRSAGGANKSFFLEAVSVDANVEIVPWF